jgi:hypothetical protein
VGVVVIVAMICVFVGAYIMFKGRNAIPGERFLGSVPKGQVFSVPEAEGAGEFPDSDEDILKRTNRFLNMFSKDSEGTGG